MGTLKQQCGMGVIFDNLGSELTQLIMENLKECDTKKSE